MPLEHFELLLKNVRSLTPTVRHLTFERTDGKPFLYQAGQFVTLQLQAQDGRQVRRSYSLADAPTASPTVSFAISYVKDGLASELFFHREPERIQASGPYGKLVLPQEAFARYVLIATGTGVTPYRSMRPELERLIAEEHAEVELLLGVRTRDELLYGDEFRAWAAQSSRMRFYPCFSRLVSSDCQGDENSGYVQNCLPKLGLDPERDIVFLCGNPPMIDETLKILSEQNFPSERIRREKYVFSK